MVVYNFKTIAVVPTGAQFIDVILSKTQRKTPTQIHRGNKISQIRAFYMRKVKYTQTNFHEKTTQILDEFPRLDEIHPFYADLINVLYSRDHYKLALGQISTAKTLIDKIGKDYLHLIKFGDTLYRCKELKRAALGRMCTVTKKLSASFGYLEQVRQHLSRLPSIDPDTRTLLVTGYPNVGKSSFINKISRANVDVQPYPFTTKSLFVGHLDHRYVRWQVIDTPGILDKPLEERNTIEMQSVTALAHLNACVMFFIDISETCGYSLRKQVDLFHSIRPLFSNKPLLIVLTKSDLKRLEDLNPEDQQLVQGMKADRDVHIISMSNATEEGITQVKTTACDTLLAYRVQRKLGSKRLVDVVNRIQITQPVKRDDKVRAASIPESVVAEKKATRARKAKEAAAKLAKEQGGALMDDQDDSELGPSAGGPTKSKRVTEKELELQNGGPGVYNFDYRKHFQLEHEEEKWDIQPEIIDGKNIADFISADIEERLQLLEREEDQLEAEFQAEQENQESDLDDEQKELVAKIKARKAEIKEENKMNKANNRPRVPRKYRVRKLEDVEEKLQREQGLDTSKLHEGSKTRTSSKTRNPKRGRSPAPKPLRGGAAGGEDASSLSSPGGGGGEGAAAAAGGASSRASSRARSKSKPRSLSQSTRAGSAGRSKSRALTPGEGYRNVRQKTHAAKLNLNSQKVRDQDARIGEGDRRYFQKKPKHLNSGKRGIGKTDWR